MLVPVTRSLRSRLLNTSLRQSRQAGIFRSVTLVEYHARRSLHTATVHLPRIAPFIFPAETCSARKQLSERTDRAATSWVQLQRGRAAAGFHRAVPAFLKDNHNANDLRHSSSTTSPSSGTVQKETVGLELFIFAERLKGEDSVHHSWFEEVSSNPDPLTPEEQKAIIAAAETASQNDGSSWSCFGPSSEAKPRSGAGDQEDTTGRALFVAYASRYIRDSRLAEVCECKSLTAFLNYIEDWQSRCIPLLPSLSAKDLLKLQYLLKEEILNNQTALGKLMDAQAATSSSISALSDEQASLPSKDSPSGTSDQPVAPNYIRSLPQLKKMILGPRFLDEWEKSAGKCMGRGDFTAVDLANVLHLYATTGVRPSTAFFEQWQEALVLGPRTAEENTGAVQEANDLQLRILQEFSTETSAVGKSDTASPGGTAAGTTQVLLQSFDSHAFSNSVLSLAFLFRKFRMRPSRPFLNKLVGHFHTLLRQHTEATRRMQQQNAAAAEEAGSLQAFLLMSPEQFANSVYALSVMCDLALFTPDIIDLMELEFLRILTQGLHPAGIPHLVFAFHRFWSAGAGAKSRQAVNSGKSAELEMWKRSEGELFHVWRQRFAEVAEAMEHLLKLEEEDDREDASQKKAERKEESGLDKINANRIIPAEEQHARRKSEVKIDDEALQQLQQLALAFEDEILQSEAQHCAEKLLALLEIYTSFVLHMERILQRCRKDFTETSWNATQNRQRLLLEARQRLRGGAPAGNNAQSKAGSVVKNDFLVHCEGVLGGTGSVFGVEQQSGDLETTAPRTDTGQKLISTTTTDLLGQRAEALRLFASLQHIPSDGFLVAVLDHLASDLATLETTTATEEEHANKLAQLESVLRSVKVLLVRKTKTSTNGAVSRPVAGRLASFLHAWETACLFSMEQCPGEFLVEVLVQLADLQAEVVLPAPAVAQFAPSADDGAMGTSDHYEGKSPASGEGDKIGREVASSKQTKFLQVWEMKAMERLPQLQAREIIVLALAFGRLGHSWSEQFAALYGKRVEEILSVGR
ncbi:unnamed protein product [Amoebophrya sp. A120]|nr:unnamed protein product [Amoebophrya sp. A120]|eukprot:GSA120T00020170001.1